MEDRKRVEAVAVHDFRAAMKSWRAFLRLVEPHLGPRSADGAPRPATWPGCSPAHATPKPRSMPWPTPSTHAPSHRLSSQSWETIRAQAGGYSRRRRRPRASHRPSAPAISAALDRAEARIERWPLDEVTFSDVAEGLREDYRRARHLIPDDWRAASAQDLHELRQRVVVHRYQMELVEPLWPRLGRSWVREAQKLRNRLGKVQDLAVLSRYAEPHQPLARWRSRLQSVISQRQAQHVAASRRIAGRLFAEKPKAFRQRLEAMWEGMAASR